MNNVVRHIISKKAFKKIFTVYLLFLLLMFVFTSIFIPVVSSKNDKTNPPVENSADTPAADIVASNHAEEVVADTPTEDVVEDVVKVNPSVENSADTPAADIVASNHAEKVVSNSYDNDDNEESNIIEITSTSEEYLGEIMEGDEIEIEPENNQESSIQIVTFTPSSNQKKVKLTVSSFNGKPAEVEDIPEISQETHEVYKYVDVKLTSNNTYIGESGVESLTFTFTVEKTWINENQIDKSTVLMFRFHGEEWQQLETTLISENETAIVYEAETPGLSTFAVVGDRVVESSVSIVNEAPQIPWSIYIAVISATVMVLFLVLFKARYIYIDEDNSKETKKV